jgi:hypothetical protein
MRVRDEARVRAAYYYAQGRSEALDEVLAIALRVRGRGDERDESCPEHDDGSYAAAAAIVGAIRKAKKRKFPRGRRR